MSIIQIKNLTFGYPGMEPILKNVNLNLDTTWRLGLLGRNGRGKTTLLKLLAGSLAGNGEILAAEKMQYFPVMVENEHQTALQAAKESIAPFAKWEEQMEKMLQDPTQENIEQYGEIEHLYAAAGGYQIEEQIQAEAGKLGIVSGVLPLPYSKLSGGEKVKLLLAAQFLKKNTFLLIDEPTDHLDSEGRKAVAKWLSEKKGFIVTSHDRAFLDQAVNMVLSINKNDIELQKGNYSSWKYNRTLQDQFEIAENEKLEKNIARLRQSARRAGEWAGEVEKTKYERNRGGKKITEFVDRGFIGHQAARMMQRSKAIENRVGKEIEEKQSLLKNVEKEETVFFQTLGPPQSKILTFETCSLAFGERALFEDFSLTLEKGQRLAIAGTNGSGKSCLLKLALGELLPTKGKVLRNNGLIISSVQQETNRLRGSLRQFADEKEIDFSLFLALLRKLAFERDAFDTTIENYSAGQKKKVQLAASLALPAHLFIWDEPLNYVDIASREQLEQAILLSQPTMLLVEHDAEFVGKVATGVVQL